MTGREQDRAVDIVAIWNAKKGNTEVLQDYDQYLVHNVVFSVAQVHTLPNLPNYRMPASKQDVAYL